VIRTVKAVLSISKGDVDESGQSRRGSNKPRSSVYIKDPDGLILEFTLDAPSADQIAQDRMADARGTLARWLQGDHTSNNVYR
jgi:hypothetical protein